jgi:hypothetical protein
MGPLDIGTGSVDLDSHPIERSFKGDIDAFDFGVVTGSPLEQHHLIVACEVVEYELRHRGSVNGWSTYIGAAVGNRQEQDRKSCYYIDPPHIHDLTPPLSDHIPKPINYYHIAVSASKDTNLYSGAELTLREFWVLCFGFWV